LEDVFRSFGTNSSTSASHKTLPAIQLNPSFMTRHFLLCLLLLSFASTYGQFDTKMKIEYSKSVADSFEIYISLPPGYNSNDTYNIVYYCDANLKSGKHLRELISTSQYNNLRNSIFVGIGHIGNYHVLRRRDFILPTIKGNDTVGRDKNYGQTEKFYSYLKKELVPSINSRFKTNIDSNSILGHSLGGLFAFYCLFKSDNLFSKYFALSPSLWIDKYSIYKFNHILTGFAQRKYLYFASGSNETINKILKGTNEAKQFLDKKHYSNLIYNYDVWKGKTHNSEVPLSLEKILKEKL
jgi:predicted alpha/beta superfamily hydrolase